MIEVEEPDPSRLPEIEEFYDQVGYIHGRLEGDRFIIAIGDAGIVGVTRCCAEEGVNVLRGMYLADGYHRVGLGTRMLKAFVERLAGPECWVVAYRHLLEFYKQGGFKPENPDDAPPFLRERMLQYREDGQDVMLMRRSAHWHWTPAYGP